MQLLLVLTTRVDRVTDADVRFEQDSARWPLVAAIGVSASRRNVLAVPAPLNVRGPSEGKPLMVSRRGYRAMNGRSDRLTSVAVRQCRTQEQR